MWAALLSFAASVISALPKTLEIIRAWQKDQQAAREEAAKNQRNHDAIADARRDTLPPHRRL
jgi:hypothetical protein